MRNIIFILFLFYFGVIKAQTPLNQTAFNLLNQQNVSYPYTFVVIGDTREGYDVQNDIAGDYETMMSPVFLNILSELQNLNPKPDFILHLGDAVLGKVDNGDVNNDATVYQQYPAYHYYISDFMNNTQIPFFTIPGNHEFWVDWNANLFLQYIGNLYDYFDYGNTRIIWTNNGENYYDGSWKEYWFSNNDLDFVNNKLTESNRPAVVFTACHVPLYVGPQLTEQYKINSFKMYYNILKDNNETANFSGHQHNYQRYLYCEDGVNDIVTGGGGAELEYNGESFVPSQLTGKHHFLVVTVSENNKAKVKMYFYQDGHNTQASGYDFIIPTENSQWVQNETVYENKTYFYSAYKNLYLAGDNTYFKTKAGSVSEVTAGKVIHLKKGTHIKSGSKFHAYISDFSCNQGIDFSNLKKSELFVNTDNYSTFSGNDVKIYPNPANDFIIINNMQLSNYNIEIYNSFGQKLKTINTVNKNMYKINISDLQSGIYVLSIKNKEKIITKKIIKQ